MDQRDFERVAGITRRRLLRDAAVVGIGAASTGLVAACGGSTAAKRGDGDKTLRPKRGGRLRVGLVGGGKSESFNPAFAQDTVIGIVRAHTVFDALFRFAPDATVVAGLAESWRANADASSWHIKLRSGVEWHDGRPLTVDDVIYSLRQQADPKHGAASSVANIRMHDLKKVDNLTLVVPLKTPSAELPAQLANANNAIVPDGTKDFSKPIGTGPFKFVSFTPGERSTHTRNPNYWDHGKPYVDELELISIDDDSARLNALRGGTIDVMAQLPFAQAKALKSGDSGLALIETPGLTPQVFYMRVDQPPFDDIRVRQAMKLIPDRQALIDNALSGFGAKLTDIFGRGAPYYAKSLPQREQDLEQAKSLLKQAGREGLRLRLETSSVGAGVVEASTLFAEQAKGAGVQIDVKRIPANAYFDTSLRYLKMPFAAGIWLAGSLREFYTLALTSNAPYNETHWFDKRFDKSVAEAISATTATQATERWFEPQKVQYERGGYIMWASQSNVDAASARVHGITPSRVNFLGMPTGLMNAWIA